MALSQQNVLLIWPQQIIIVVVNISVVNATTVLVETIHIVVTMKLSPQQLWFAVAILKKRRLVETAKSFPL